MGEHTPGPWSMKFGGMPQDSGFSVVSNSAQAEMVKVVAECWPTTIISEEHRQEVFANGHLIEAAPLLLEACEAAEGRLACLLREFRQANFTDRYGDGDAIEDVLVRVRSAIAAGKGET